MTAPDNDIVPSMPVVAKQLTLARELRAHPCNPNEISGGGQWQRFNVLIHYRDLPVWRAERGEGCES
jgi:hypothetical protein